MAASSPTSIATLANPFAGGPEAPVEIQVAFDGDDPELAAQVIDPIRALGTVLSDDVTLMPYGDVLVDGATPPPGIQLVTRSAFVGPTSVPGALRTLTEIATAQGSPAIAIRSVGGAVSRVPDDATAYAHRQAELMVITTTVGPEPVIAAGQAAFDAVWGKLAPHVTGAYANFLTTATDKDVAAVYPSATYQRLAAVKSEYDPANLFAANHNVKGSN